MKTLTSMSFAAAALVLGAGSASAASPENGKKVYEEKGCWQCHGYEGQGGVAGPRLANTALPQEALIAFVHGSNGAMPPYSKRLVSDEQLADVWAYLQSKPKPADPKTIPMLQR